MHRQQWTGYYLLPAGRKQSFAVIFLELVCLNPDQGLDIFWSSLFNNCLEVVFGPKNNHILVVNSCPTICSGLLQFLNLERMMPKKLRMGRSFELRPQTQTIKLHFRCFFSCLLVNFFKVGGTLPVGLVLS